MSGDRDPLRAVFGRFATGVTVLAAGRETPRGMTANSFASVSLTPPLVLVCVHQTAAIHAAVLEAQSFSVSVLSARQEQVARHFADRTRPRGQQEFDVIGWTPGPNTGAPLLHGTLAWIECSLKAAYAGGDHSIFLGEVLASQTGIAREPLLFFDGKFHTPALHQPDAEQTAARRIS